jgi:hypothetical protein
MVDFRFVFDRITISDLLDAAGIPHKGNRCACPIHGGNNPTSFSFMEWGFYCFSCGAKGGLLDLGVALWGCGRQEALGRLCAMAGIDTGNPQNGGKLRTLIAQPRLIPYRHTNVARVLAEERLEALKDLQFCILLALRTVRKALKIRNITLGEFYFCEQLYLYQLEELDTRISFEIASARTLTKGGII